MITHKNTSITFVLCFLLTFFTSTGQNANRADSMRRVIEKDAPDTNKVNHLAILVDDLQFIWKDCEPLIKEQFQLSRKLKFWRGEAKAFRQLGWCYQVLSDYKNASASYDSALAIYKAHDFKIGIADVYNSKGSIGDKLGSLDEAHRYYLEAMKIYEQENYPKGLSKVLVNIANIQSNQGELEKATRNMLKSLEINIRLKDMKSEGICYSNLGNYQKKKNNIDSALYYYKKSLHIKLVMGDIRGEAASYSRISGIMEAKGKLDSAIYYTKKALGIFTKLNDKSKAASKQIELAQLKLKANAISEAIQLCSEALNTGELINDLDIQTSACSCLASAYELKKDGMTALKYFHRYEVLHDSLSNSEINKQIARNEVSYQYEKEMFADSLQNVEREKNILAREEEKLARQRIITWSGIIGFILMLVIAFLFFKSSKQKQKDNLLLESKNKIIEEKSKILEEKNKDITDSIKYARYIQNTILPHNDYTKAHLGNGFIYYQPKDIVSGDFYFVKQKKDFIYVAAVDCTGHGVPGAFISILANNLLHQAIAELDTPTPAEILNYIEARDEDEIEMVNNADRLKDGMDIALCRIDKKNNSLLFAGANNPLYVFENGNLNEIKGTKASIAIFHPSKKEVYVNHTIPLNGNKCFYVFTDGYADQFGGANGKKFKYSRLKEEIIKAGSLDSEEQKNQLTRVFQDWKGELEQIDDVLIIGFKA